MHLCGIQSTGQRPSAYASPLPDYPPSHPLLPFSRFASPQPLLLLLPNRFLRPQFQLQRLNSLSHLGRRNCRKACDGRTRISASRGWTSLSGRGCFTGLAVRSQTSQTASLADPYTLCSLGDHDGGVLFRTSGLELGLESRFVRDGSDRHARSRVHNQRPVGPKYRQESRCVSTSLHCRRPWS